jgi:hypothetical protein
MAITHEDMQEIKKILDDRYVQIVDCDNKQTDINKKFANDDKRIEIIAHDFGVIKKLMWAVATASIGSLVVAFFELILR